MSTQNRLNDWFSGAIEDHDLTKKDVKELQARVDAAVAKKILSREGVHVFPDHKTLQ